MSALVNLNARSFPDEPSGAITEADLLRAIAAGADGDCDCSGWGDFSHTMPQPELNIVFISGEANPFNVEPADRRFWAVPLQPAEAATEVGADTGTPPISPHALAWLFDAYPRTAIIATVCAILICLGLGDTNDTEAEHEQLQAASDAASEVQP